MRRREFFTLLGGAAAAWPLAARAQQPVRMRRIGILLGTSAGDPEWRRRIGSLSQVLQAGGWVEGQSFAFESRYAEGKSERLLAFAAELVQANVDLIITQGAQPIDAARKATSTIPIVMAQSGDAVRTGIIASLSRPGGNITGMTLNSVEQVVKRLQLVRDFSADFVRVAAICSMSPAHRLQREGMEAAAPALGITLQSLPNRNSDEVDASLRAAARANAQVIFTMEDPLIEGNREHIVRFAMQRKIPVIGEFRPIAMAGALMTYSPNQVEMWRRAAVFVDKILKGAKPADLPVEQPDRFELLINLKTAKALGFDVPARLLALADEVIE